MSKTAARWIRFILLFVFVFIGGQLWVGRMLLDRDWARVASEAGLKLYGGKGPYGIFVNKDYPQDTAVSFFQDGVPTEFIDGKYKDMVGRTGIKDVPDKDGRRMASFSVGVDYQMTCVYVVSPEPKVLQWVLMDGKYLSRDLNADGTMDARNCMIPPSGLGEVWLKGEWKAVAESLGDYRKRLSGGEVVEFDGGSGQWR